MALLEDRPTSQLKAGQMGTVVELLGKESADGFEAYEVEFCDARGVTIACESLARSEFLVLIPTAAGRAS